jgi:hypothetical protein
MDGISIFLTRSLFASRLQGQFRRFFGLAASVIAALAIVRCSGQSAAPIVQAGPGILVVNSDYGSAGSYSYLPVSGSPLRDIATIGSDAVGAFAGNRVAIVNRFGQDNILFLTSTLQPGLQFSVGNGANPYDIVELDAGHLLVSRYGAASLWVVNPGDGSRLSEIDLSAYADSDGVPEMAFMVAAGSPRRILIALQRLTNFAPSDFSSFVVLNPGNLAVETVRRFSLKAWQGPTGLRTGASPGSTAPPFLRMRSFLPRQRCKRISERLLTPGVASISLPRIFRAVRRRGLRARLRFMSSFLGRRPSSSRPLPGSTIPGWRGFLARRW